MENVVSKSVAIIVAVILLCIIPSLYIQTFTFKIMEDEVDMKTRMFVNSVRNKGYISKDMYENLLKNTIFRGNVMEVDLEHRKLIFEPDEDGKVISHYRVYNTDDILEDINEKDYYLDINDEFIVTVKSINETEKQILFRSLFSLKTNGIYSRYGGCVKNEFY